MVGPNSAPNGDTRLMLGHIDTVYVCTVHGDRRLDECEDEIAFSTWPKGRKTNCKIIPLRWYLQERGRLTTGKTV